MTNCGLRASRQDGVDEDEEQRGCRAFGKILCDSMKKDRVSFYLVEKDIFDLAPDRNTEFIVVPHDERVVRIRNLVREDVIAVLG